MDNYAPTSTNIQYNGFFFLKRTKMGFGRFLEDFSIVFLCLSMHRGSDGFKKNSSMEWFSDYSDYLCLLLSLVVDQYECTNIIMSKLNTQESQVFLSLSYPWISFKFELIILTLELPHIHEHLLRYYVKCVYLLVEKANLWPSHCDCSGLWRACHRDGVVFQRLLSHHSVWAWLPAREGAHKSDRQTNELFS